MEEFKDLSKSIEESDTKTTLLSLLTLDGGRELFVISSKDNLLGLKDGHPSGDLKCLGGLINDTNVKEFLLR
jgi:hypothetical protein